MRFALTSPYIPAPCWTLDGMRKARLEIGIERHAKLISLVKSLRKKYGRGADWLRHYQWGDQVRWAVSWANYTARAWKFMLSAVRTKARARLP